MDIDFEAVKAMASDYAEAWGSGLPETVAAFFAETGQIVINRGEPWKGRGDIARMAAGFYADFPDLVVRCDDVRMAGRHVLFAWTLEGNHATTGNAVKIGGWEEWELDDALKIASSLGWYDPDDYARQVGGSVDELLETEQRQPPT